MNLLINDSYEAGKYQLLGMPLIIVVGIYFIELKD